MRKLAVAVAVAVAMGIMANQAMAGQLAISLYGSTGYTGQYSVDKNNADETKVSRGVGKTVSTNTLCATTENNEFEVKSGEWGEVYGGYSSEESSVSETVASNTVTISGNIEAGLIFGGYTESENGKSGQAISNTVTISGTVTGGQIIGGYSWSTASKSGDVTDNTVIISGTVNCGDVIGGRSNIYQGQTGVTSGNASRNRVLISSTVQANVYGGMAYVDHDLGVSGGAKSNTVVVSGTVNGFVIAGSSVCPSATNLLVDNNAVDNNAVIWQGSINGAAVAGGYSIDNQRIYGTSNTLAVVGSGKTTGTVLGFQRYIFLLDDGVVIRKGSALDSSNAMLTTTYKGVYGVDVSGAQIGVGLKAGSSSLQKGDKAILVNSLATSNTTVAPAVDTSAITSELARNGNEFAAQTIASLESKVNKYKFALSTDTIESKHCLVAEVTSVAPNAVTTDVRHIASSNFVNFRSQMSDVTQRMGELRTTNTDGTWARLFGGKYRFGSGMKEKSVTLQVGADRWFNPNSYVGVTGSYTKADDTLTQGTNDQKNWNIGFYGGYVADNGLYVDAIVKHGQFKNDFSLAYEGGELSKGKYHTYGTSLSVEGGWRLNCPTTAHYLEPQIELTYGHLQSATFNANDVKYQNDAVDSIVSRIGIATGYKFKDDKGNLYLKASLLHDFKGKVKTRATSGAETDGGSTRDLGGTWGEFVLGGNYKASKNVNLYGEMMCSTKNAGVKTKWQGSIGARWTF